MHACADRLMASSIGCMADLPAVEDMHKRICSRARIQAYCHEPWTRNAHDLLVQPVVLYEQRELAVDYRPHRTGPSDDPSHEESAGSRASEGARSAD